MASQTFFALPGGDQGRVVNFLLRLEIFSMIVA
jgi:hypothetical protein